MLRIPFTNFVIGRVAEDSGPSVIPKVMPFLSGKHSRKPETDFSGYKINYSSLFTVYKTQGDVYGCVREWKESVGAAGWKLEYINDPEKEVDASIYTQVEAIFNYDPKRPWSKMRKRIIRDLGVTGNSFVHLVRNKAKTDVVGLTPIDPRTMSIVSDEHGVIYRYIQKVGNHKPVSFEPNEIMHFTFDEDPDHELFGFSPMEPIIWDIRTDIAAGIANYFFFKNDSTPAVQYILEPGVAASKEKREQAMDSINDQFQGVKNKGKGGVLVGVKEVKTIGLSQKDMEYLGGRRFSTEKICAAYGVPRFRLGYTDTVNNNNGVELIKGFYEGTIEPLEELFDHVINNQFLWKVGLEGQVKYVTIKRDFTKADTQKVALEELRAGVLTMRQYKQRTGQDIMPEDEKDPNFDAHIIHNGASAVLLEDVGVEPVIDPNDPEMAQNMIDAIQTLHDDDSRN